MRAQSREPLAHRTDRHSDRQTITPDLQSSVATQHARAYRHSRVRSIWPTEYSHIHKYAHAVQVNDCPSVRSERRGTASRLRRPLLQGFRWAAALHEHPKARDKGRWRSFSRLQLLLHRLGLAHEQRVHTMCIVGSMLVLEDGIGKDFGGWRDVTAFPYPEGADGPKRERVRSAAPCCSAGNPPC